MPLAVHDERLTRRVGAAVLVAAALTVVLVTGVIGRMDPDGVTVRIRFGRVLSLPAGAPVRIAGRDIGVVRSVAIAPGGGVITEITVDHGWAARIPINAEFFVDARSVLAPRYIAIGPPPGNAPPERALQQDDLVTGIDPPDLDRMLQRTWDSLNDLSTFLAAIRPASQQLQAATARLGITIDGLDPHPGASAELREAVAGTIGSVEALVADLRGGRLDPGDVVRLVARVEALAARVEVTTAELRERVVRVRAAVDRARARLGPVLGARLDAALASADGALAGAEQLATGVRGVLADATTGNGALAAFAADRELADELQELTKILKRKAWRIVFPPPH